MRVIHNIFVVCKVISLSKYCIYALGNTKQLSIYGDFCDQVLSLTIHINYYDEKYEKCLMQNMYEGGWKRK